MKMEKYFNLLFKKVSKWRKYLLTEISILNVFKQSEIEVNRYGSNIDLNYQSIQIQDTRFVQKRRGNFYCNKTVLTLCKKYINKVNTFLVS